MSPSKKSRISKRSLRILSKHKSYLRLRTENTIAPSKTSFGDSHNSKPHDEWEGLERRLAVAQILAVAALVILLLASCSASKQISSQTTAISEAASSSSERFAYIQSESVKTSPDLPRIEQAAQGGLQEQADIISRSSKIHYALTGVEDRIPEWVYLLEYITIALIILGVGWILWYTGIGAVVKRLLGFIPRAKRQEADLAYDVMDTNSPATMREFVAAKRASDAEFDRAYERTRTQRTGEVRTDERPSSRIRSLDA